MRPAPVLGIDIAAMLGLGGRISCRADPRIQAREHDRRTRPTVTQSRDALLRLDAVEHLGFGRSMCYRERS